MEKVERIGKVGEGKVLLIGINAIALIVAIATFLGFAGSVWWFFSFLEHPRPQYCLILTISIVVGLLSCQPWTMKQWSLLWLVPLIVNLSLVLPTAWGIGGWGSKAAIAQPTTHLRLLHITLDRDNLDVSQAVKLANQQGADLLSLLEVSPETLPTLQTELKNYQLIKAEPRNNSHGSAWFAARHPQQPIRMLGAEVIHLPSSSDRPLLKATIEYAGRTIELLCFHSIRPRSAGTVAYQQQEFAALAEWSQQQQNRSLIVVGDFNNTPWSLSFRHLLANSGLANSQTGFGIQPTWHSSLPPFLQIPIDHCLHSSDLSTRDRRVGSNIGSDHLPIFVEFKL